MRKLHFLFLSLAFVACGKEDKKTDATTEPVAENKVEEAKPTPTVALRYAANDELYVLAVSGLNLRDKADANGAKLANVGYGSKVKVLAEDLGKTPYSVEEMPGFKIDGHWVKVDFGGKVGYLFDGFLSKWAAPLKSSYDFAVYLDKMCKKVKSDKTKPKKADPRDADVFEYEKIDYADGTTLVMQVYEGGANDEIKFAKDKITLAEAYLVMIASVDKKNTKCKYDAAKKYITCESEMELLEIREENGQIIARSSIAD